MQPFKQIEATTRDVDNILRRTTMAGEVWTITPDVAAYITDNFNDANRPQKKGRQGQMADDMKHGRFLITGDSIKFGTDQKLKDGQNRLFACQSARVPFDTLVLGGVNANAFKVMDTGVGRSPNDIFALAKVKNYQDMAGATKWLRWITNDPMFDRTTETGERLLAFYNQHPNLQHARSKTIIKLGKMRIYPVKLLIALNYIFGQKHATAADLFFDDLLRGSNSTNHPAKRYPPLIMHDFLRRETDAAAGRYHDRLRLLVIVTAWNAFATKKSLATSDLQALTIQTRWPGIVGSKY